MLKFTKKYWHKIPMLYKLGFITAILLPILLFTYLRDHAIGIILIFPFLAVCLAIYLLAYSATKYIPHPKKYRSANAIKSAISGLILILIVSIVVYGISYIDRFARDNKPLPIKDRYLAVIVVDGASLNQAKKLFMEGLGKANYFTSMSTAFPNISRYFIQQGAFTANGVSVWPSSSIPAHTGIITGNYPRNTGVMGQRQFDPVKRKYTSYIGLGILDHRNILSDNTKALCEYFPKTRSVDVLQIANRGCSLFIPGTPHDSQVIGRISTVIDSTAAISRLTKTNEIPRIMIATLPDIDHQTHNQLLSSQKSIELYKETDRNIGKIMDIYRKHGIFDKTLFVLASDHGMGEVNHHVTLDNLMHDMRFDTYQSLKWGLIPEWGKFEANFYVGTKYKFNQVYNSVALWGGNSDGLIYLKGQTRNRQGRVIEENWDIKATDENLKNYFVGGTDINVIQYLLDYSPGIGFLLTNPSPNTYNVYSRIGQSQITERQTGKFPEFRYQIISGKDPLGYDNNPQIKPFIQNKTWLSDDQWLSLNYLEGYPDAIRRIAYSFGNKSSGTINLVAANSWDFTPYYVAKKATVGSHGSLNSDQSQVPIMFYGPGIKNVEMPYARTVDILPTILAYFGITPDHIDGRPLPVFSDPTTMSTNTESIPASTVSDDKYLYQLEEIYASYDRQLVRYDKISHTKEILLPSIRSTFPYLAQKVNLTLSLDGISDSKKDLVLHTVHQAQNVPGVKILFNLENNKFSTPEGLPNEQ